MIESGEAAASRWNDLARDMKYSRASAGIARARARARYYWSMDFCWKATARYRRANDAEAADGATPGRD